MAAITKPLRDITELEEGDEFLFNDRRVPVTVTESRPVGAKVGAIHVRYRVKADGPAAGRLWLEETGTGRIRIKESAPWGPYGSVRDLRYIEKGF